MMRFSRTAKELSIRNLTGRGIKAGSVPMIDVYIAKLGLREHLLATVLDAHMWDDRAKPKFREIFSSHKSYRSKYAPLDGTLCDLTWMSGWGAATKSLWDFMEKLLYTQEYDGCIKLGLKSRKTVPELLESGTIKAMLSESIDAIQKETVTPSLAQWLQAWNTVAAGLNLNSSRALVVELSSSFGFVFASPDQTRSRGLHSSRVREHPIGSSSVLELKLR